ncbi:exodeoxyribonuclease VII large subunit [Pikeienuella piscinae]|uniref:Exodeoxyribonuclease 7 large subunit n=1 Tax=Pikeienuella piscinae TaxID=2748098 RepID=A0A7L5BX79_9RHOB|nr:exodeoxyribonuclease VII large subunit [Pikeienuella piscinae]QIE55448.1 exodeoxyribonuclease VII large subunit [Pikeienuella piscinae]
MDLLEDEPDAGNAPEFTVSELSGAVKRVVEGAFDHVRVRGEIGRVSRPRSGHLYLDLKDDRAVLNAIVWKGVAARLEVDPEEGMEVIATGRLTTYPGQSRYQLIVESLAPAGMGALMAMLEKRKAALAAEGLFAAERKRALPYLPRVVGVVTSPSGAVIRDILHRLAERFPLHVLVWPVAVQGKKCAPEVAAAIRGFNALGPDGATPRPDVLIVARGGGSVEDLWGFNEEIVVRAAAESAIPLISAIGHETDTTLIDLAADRRAPTPTGAAEIAAPVRGELLAALKGLEERRARSIGRLIEERRRRLRDLARALPRPDEIVAERRQRLDMAGERLPLALQRAADRKRIAFAAGAAGRFGPALLTEKIDRRRERLLSWSARLGPALARRSANERSRLNERAARLARAPAAMARRQAEARARLEGVSLRLSRIGAAAVRDARRRLDETCRLLTNLGPKGVLARGYAIVHGRDGVLMSAKAAAPGDELRLQLADGDVGAVVVGASKPARKAGSAPKPKPGQGMLDL